MAGVVSAALVLLALLFYAWTRDPMPLLFVGLLAGIAWGVALVLHGLRKRDGA